MAQIFTKWSDLELTRLREMAGKFTASQISKEIGRGVDGVLKQIKKQGLRGYGHPRKDVPIPSTHKPVQSKRKVKKAQPKPTILRKPIEADKPKRVTVRGHVEYCPVCKSPVSNWDDHLERLGRFGCRRLS